MPTTTSKGYRIPDDTDPVADGAAAIRNLGTDVNNMIQGDDVIADGTGAVTADVTWAYNNPYPKPPIVTASPAASTGKYTVTITNRTETSVNLVVRATDDSNIPSGTNVHVQCIAVPAP